MPFFDDFEASSDKSQFLTHNEISPSIYLDLCALSQANRKKFVEQVFDLRHSLDYTKLLQQLSYCCYQNNKDIYIRGGSADILGHLLQHGVQTLQHDQLIEGNYWENYKPLPEISLWFDVLANHLKSKDSPEALANLPKNIVLKVFNPIVINHCLGREDLSDVVDKLQSFGANTEQCAIFFNQLLGRDLVTLPPENMGLSPHDSLMRIKSEVFIQTPERRRRSIFDSQKRSHQPTFYQLQVRTIIEQYECSEIDATEALDRIDSLQNLKEEPKTPATPSSRLVSSIIKTTP
jgi:hypothetical protein